MNTTVTLNEQFGIAGKIEFHKGKGDLITATVKSQYATAELSLYGAQILSYIPQGQKNILWISDKSLFEEGKAVRGGIPLCFPWFGPHATDKAKPQHGFARLQYWNVIETKETKDGGISISLQIKESPASMELWPFAFTAVAEFIVGKKLEVKLSVTNNDNKSFEYSDALHTYFNISDINKIALEGLQNATYYDAFGTELKTQQEPLLHFTGETNRRYVHTSANCIIHDNGFNRKIGVGKTGSKVTVVWNPAEATTKTMSDMEPGGYKTFVCVEPANAYAGIDMIQLVPGQNHTLSTVIEVL